MIRFGKVIGANTDFLTAQAFAFPKTILEEVGEKESVSLALIISASGEDVFTKVRQTAPQIEELFFSGETDPPLSQKMGNVLSFLKKELETVENLQILIASCKENVLYLISQGLHQACLLREGKILSLISEQQTNGQLISGYIKEGDRLLLLSSKLENSEGGSPDWPQETVKKLLETQIDNLEEEVNLSLHQSPAPEPVAIILLENPPKKQPVLENAERINQADMVKPYKFRLPSVNISLSDLKTRLLPRSKKAKLAVISLFTLIILALTSFFLYQSYNSGKNLEKQLALQGIRDKITEAESKKDSDPSQAQARLKEGKDSLNDFLSKNPNNSEALELKKQIEESTGSILKIYNITDFPLFLSLDLIKQNFNSKRLSYSLGKTLFLDDAEKSLVLLDLDNKKNTILAGKTQLGDAKFASINGANAFVYSEDKGIIKVDIENQKISTVGKPDPEWGKITDLYGFGGNVYLLDSLKNQIWKYVPTESGYSDKQTYLKEGQSLDFAGSKRLTIDYSVWVLKQGPEIYRFTGGVSDSFSVGGMDQPLQEMQTFYVGEGGEEGPTSDNSFAYFLDSQNSRLVVLKKNGQYYAQYLGDKFKTATDFAVDESAKKIYLLEGGKIYQLDLH